MAYGVKYRMNFKNIKTAQDCRFDILEKDYAGGFTNLIGEGRSPVVQSWDGQSILDPIRGCKCVVSYVNERMAGVPVMGLLVNDNRPQPYLYLVSFSGSNLPGTVTIDITTTAFSGSFSVPVTLNQSIVSMVSALIAVINADPNFIASVSGGGNALFVRDSADNTIITATTTVPGGVPGYAPLFPISLFLTTDDTQFMGNLYVANELKFTGFMVIDDFAEPYLTPPTGNTLTFTDNLALLDNLTLADVGYTPITGRKFITDIIQDILSLTNLTLPLLTYYNLFPEGVDDRDDDPAADAFSNVMINTNSYLVDDDGFDDCRTVLEKILKANCCILIQQQGNWTIVRQPEYKRFSGNIPGSKTEVAYTVSATWGIPIPGVRIISFPDDSLAAFFTVGGSFYIQSSTDSRLNGVYSVVSVQVTAGELFVRVNEEPVGPGPISFTGNFIFPQYSTAPTISDISISKTGDLIPIERSQLNSFTRPTKTVINTFNYRIPQLLANSKLQRLGAFIGSSVIGDYTLDDYQLQDWTNQNNEAAFIRIVTNTATGTEVDRYIYMPFRNNDPGSPGADAIVSNIIEINQNDKFNLSMTIRALDEPTGNRAFFFGIHLLSRDGLQKKVLALVLNPNPQLVGVQWVDTTEDWDDLHFGQAWNLLSSSVFPNWYTSSVQIDGVPGTTIPPFPFDGFMKIAIYGFNYPSVLRDDVCLIKDFVFDYKLYVNESLRITGQENKATNSTAASKSLEANEIFTDDSPKFNVAGGVFYDDLTLTTNWEKQSGEAYDYRLGEINAIDQILLTSNWRTLFEGDFFGLCNPVDYADVEGLDGMFVPFKLSLDYRQNRSQASFMEVSKNSDPSFDDIAYNFRYLYKIEQR